MKLKLMYLSFLALLLVFAVSTISSQTNTGVITGTLSDPLGASIPNVKVKANRTGGIQNESPRATFSNNRGEFRFENLPFGVYVLEFTIGGSEITFKKQVEITPDHPTQNNVTILMEGCSDVDADTALGFVSDEDKAEIVRQMLTPFLLGSPYVRTKDKDATKRILSTENIKSDWIGTELKKHLVLMTQSEIQHRADTIRDFSYLRFSQLKVKAGCVEVSLNDQWAVGKNSGTLYMSGEGKTYEYRKIADHWVGKYVMGWVS